MSVSNPTNFVHKVHVGFDPVTGGFTVRLMVLHVLITIRSNVLSFPPTKIVLASTTGSTRSMAETPHTLSDHKGRLCERSASSPRCSGILY